MKKKFNFVHWTMVNYRISMLIVILMFIFGILGINRMPKQEFPEFTVRQGVVVGVYPGASVNEVEEQLTKPLERFLFTYKEVKRAKTLSTSQHGMCYIMVELNDNVNNKDEVWSKIKHGLSLFKSQLPSGVVAVIANDDFGDTSALLIAVESDKRSYRELQTYTDELGDRLRQVESVSNIRSYGAIKEQITIYTAQERMAVYGINEKLLSGILFSQGFTTSGGSVENEEINIPLHISPALCSEEEIANQIIYSDPRNNVVRIKDIARVTREYDMSESYIKNNGHPCVILSLEMRGGYDIVEYGRNVDKVLDDYREHVLPADVSISRIADQAKVVGDSVSSFLHELIIAMIIIILVMMILFPFRSALVAAITIPFATFISVGIMYLCGIQLNTVTLAALIVVLGMIVDDSIVIIDGYLDYLNKGYSRWYAAITSANRYFLPMLLATACICAIFFPILFTLTGQIGDFVTYFPWTITINLMVSLVLAVTTIPLLNTWIIRKRYIKTDKKRLTDHVQRLYERILGWTFRHPWLTIGSGIASVLVAIMIVPLLQYRMFPVADRDQFAVEIYLAEGTPLSRTEQVADSVYTLLKEDGRVTSITSFIGCSSPRFQTSYAPQMPAKNYAQFIVNTTSIEDTEDILDKYTNRYADLFPDAHVKFKQLDFQLVPELEFRFQGENIDSLHRAADLLMSRMRLMPELARVYTNYDVPRPVMEITLDPVAASQLGLTRTAMALNLSIATTGIPVGSVWEGDYALPVIMKNARKDSLTTQNIKDLYLPATTSPTSVPVRQIADVKPAWHESKIVHRNGMRCLSVIADLRRGENTLETLSKINKMIDGELQGQFPAGLSPEVGGEYEYDMETLPPIMSGLGIAMVIIFFFILTSFRKFGITAVAMLAMSLCLFGAMIGLWIAGKTISITSVFGFITLLGMIVRNVIPMYQHADDRRVNHRETAREAAYDAGKRRMVPIFLTTATTAVGVIPMIFSNSTFWTPVGVTIFAGGIGSLLLVITILPVVYWKLYSKNDKRLKS